MSRVLSESERELMHQRMLLDAAVAVAIREAGFEPGSIHTMTDAAGYHLAYGYLETTGGWNRRQRHVQVELTWDQYGDLDKEVRARVVAQVLAGLAAPAARA